MQKNNTTGKRLLQDESLHFFWSVVNAFTKNMKKKVLQLFKNTILLKTLMSKCDLLNKHKKWVRRYKKHDFWKLSPSEKSVKIPSLGIKIISRLDFVNPIHLPCSAIKLHQIWHIYLQMRIMSSNWATFTSNPLGVAQIFLLMLKKSCLIGYVPWYQLKLCNWKTAWQPSCSLRSICSITCMSSVRNLKFATSILLSRIVEFLQKGKIKSFPWACFHGHDLVKGQMPVLWPLESIGTPVHWKQLNQNQNQHWNNVTSDLASCNHITLEVPHSYTLRSNAWNQSFVSPLISTIVHHSVLCARWEHLPRVLWWRTARALLRDSSCLAQILLQLKSELWIHKSLGFATWYS